MISYGRYGYHKMDIAKLLAKDSLSPIEKMDLNRMQSGVGEYEAANTDKVKK